MISNVSRKTRIENRLNDLFDPIKLVVRDDSEAHAGHAQVDKDAKETHFYINLVSKSFQGMNRIEMHKKIYSILNDEFNSGLHALELNISSE